MFKLSDLLKRVERRAKRLRGFRFAGLALIVSSLISSIIVGLGHFGVLKIDRFALILTLLFPLICYLVSYFMGRAIKPNLSRLLFKIDLALGTDERLSSLFEIYRLGGRNPLKYLIEEKLQRRYLNWKKGLPLKPSSVFINAAGILIFLGLVILIFSPSLPPLATDIKEASSPSVTNSEKARVPSPSQPPIESGKVATPQEGGFSSDNKHPEAYDHPLEEIRSQPSREAILSKEDTDISHLIERQRNLTRQLSELLSELNKRLQEGNSALTKRERELLGNLRSQIRDQKLRQALGKLLEEEDPEKIKELTEQVLKLARNQPKRDEGEGRGELGRPESSSEKSPRKEASETSTPKPAVSDETSQLESGMPDKATSKEEQEEGLEESKQLPLREESRFGGKQGFSGKRTSVEKNPGFTSQDLMGVIGQEGEFEELVTKGVPIEPKAGQKVESSSYTVSYEVLRAILKKRNVPPQVRELIQNYFRSITEEGS